MEITREEFKEAIEEGEEWIATHADWIRGFKAMMGYIELSKPNVA